MLVFVEVRRGEPSVRRRDPCGGSAEAGKIDQLAAQYLARHHIKDRLCRFDVVLLKARTTSAPRIEHIQNAFDVSGDDLRW